MRYLTVQEVRLLHTKIMEQTGAEASVINPGLLDSAVAQPRMTFNGDDL